ncbi:hypothetical protein MRB53_028786 [Persea americana]|uniref:Uncharacterized protein n=1 Tax=Persea americana TaxID=3435 RepID=A0ACC2KGX1_PERAE|nr:hypothetical protein MRB53_028786 [Persea americana]
MPPKAMVEEAAHPIVKAQTTKPARRIMGLKMSSRGELMRRIVMDSRKVKNPSWQGAAVCRRRRRKRWWQESGAGGGEELIQQDRVMQLLQGLHESFSTLRSHILLIELFPSVNKVYSLVSQEEKQRELTISHLSSTGAFALVAKKINACYTQRRPGPTRANLRNSNNIVQTTLPPQIPIIVLLLSKILVPYFPSLSIPIRLQRMLLHGPSQDNSRASREKYKEKKVVYATPVREFFTVNLHEDNDIKFSGAPNHVVIDRSIGAYHVVDEIMYDPTIEDEIASDRTCTNE